MSGAGAPRLDATGELAFASGEEDGRRRRSQATRARVAAAATTLFVDRGFAATTIAAIAAAAGVSQQTIYYSFGTKEAVASAAADLAVAGDERPIPTLKRDWARQALADPDPVGQISRQVKGAAAVLLRAAPLLQAIRGAAAGNEELSRLWQQSLRQRSEVQSRFIAALRTKTALREGLTARSATDVCTLMLGPENYQLLVADLGWSHNRWHTWTRHALIRELLPPVATRTDPPKSLVDGSHGRAGAKSGTSDAVRQLHG